ncbi:hypothetical protein Ancab_025294 [Ancistrocladus abbreviatus]
MTGSSLNSLSDSQIVIMNSVKGVERVGRKAEDVWDVLLRLGVVNNVEDAAMVKPNRGIGACSWFEEMMFNNKASTMVGCAMVFSCCLPASRRGTLGLHFGSVLRFKLGSPSRRRTTGSILRFKLGSPSSFRRILFRQKRKQFLLPIHFSSRRQPRTAVVGNPAVSTAVGTGTPVSTVTYGELCVVGVVVSIVGGVFIFGQFVWGLQFHLLLLLWVSDVECTAADVVETGLVVSLMETQDCNSSDIRPEAEVGSANASNNFSPDLIEDFNDIPSNQDDFDQSTIDPSARPSKKIRSKVWDHLIKIRAENLKDQKAQCKYCNDILSADPAKGTSCLKNHIDRCKKYPANIELAQRKLALQARFSVDGSKLMMEGEPVGKLENWRFRQEDSRFVEHEGFRKGASVVGLTVAVHKDPVTRASAIGLTAAVGLPCKLVALSLLLQIQLQMALNFLSSFRSSMPMVVGLQKILSMLESQDANIRIHAVKVVANLVAEDATDVLAELIICLVEIGWNDIFQRILLKAFLRWSWKMKRHWLVAAAQKEGLEIIPQDLLKKYITYAKLNVFPRLHDADMDKLTHVYAELRRESSVT